MTAASATSPTIEALSARVLAGEGDAEAAFWAGVATSGAPLLEPIAGDAGHSLVTFVWRGDEQTREVLLFGAVTGVPLAALATLPGTAVWHASFRVANDIRSGYQFAVDAGLPEEGQARYAALDRLAMSGGLLPDPLNPRRIDFNRPQLPAISTLELPQAPPQPWIACDPDVPAGRIERETFESRALGNERLIWTYLPPGYDRGGAAYPLLVLYDGFAYLKTQLPTTLDNLIAAGRIRPLVVAMVHQLDRIAELLGDERFAACVAHELVHEWLSARYHITGDRSQTGIGGVSAGGLGAMFAGFRHPDVFGNVLSQSGSYWWGPRAQLPVDVRAQQVEWQWLTHQLDASERLPLRVYADVGALEVPDRSEHPDMLAANRRLRDVLAVKGYDVRYQEFAGGHDYACWRGTVADGLMWLYGGG
ncbi:MAG: DUF3327 domain-containing protein [Dehalococcoidia bacterium]|nr:DUF3327 domain-containing protein [Dehalococcoidia bacterium]